MLRIFLTGPHAHRTPLSYSALWPLFADHIERVPGPETADLIVLAHTWDIEGLAEPVLEHHLRHGTPIVLLSEEPFWDTMYAPDPLSASLSLTVKPSGQTIDVHQLNHHTTNIFDFEHLPYYLLTDHAFVPTLGARYRQYAKLGIRDWRRRFKKRGIDISFMAERRPEAFHDITLPEGDIVGLCAWRTQLAEQVTQDRSERLGHSWHGGPRRQDIPHWHFDKLMQMDNRARSLSAIENTHQPNYISEKLFDAFACGSRPIYYASPTHWIHRLSIPADAWTNLYGLPPETAADALNDITNTRIFFDAFRGALARLESVFCDTPRIVAERERIAAATLTALDDVVSRPAG